MEIIYKSPLYRARERVTLAWLEAADGNHVEDAERLFRAKKRLDAEIRRRLAGKNIDIMGRTL